MYDTYGNYNEQQYYADARQAATAGGDCGCGGPRVARDRGLVGPGGLPPGPGPFPPGPGPFPPGPGPFPPGPGPFPPGPGPFPPGPGPFPPGPGPFPPGPGPFPPGPGPFPPPRPPFPFPFPVPIPFPLPFPPGPQAYVTVIINGGAAFPYVTQRYFVPYRPGISIYWALAQTGAVQFTPNGFIYAVNGIRIGGRVSYRLRLNGRVIPSTLLNFPLQPYDAVGIDLIYTPFLREDEEQETTNVGHSEQ
ncbi:hypothetical protein [Paenibacillus harenae]|uniref:hypothetical protein n=1 Tax=Paenibacillus harenae TaxID=306543 RepID=UPI00279147C3|nr:hypothetical protein [Paenibacillus harenae]MDQ0063153.1 hypothetical protein [Paenibacillus harenae]